MGLLALVPLLLLILVPAPVHADFNLSVIDEILSGFDGDPSIQYVEIRMTSSTPQSSVAHTRLTLFHCDATAPTVLLTIPKNVVNSGSNTRWLMATPRFAEIACLQPDFVFQPAVPSCGMLCWGAPGTTLPTDPSTWDATDPNQYVDCVAFGGYTGTTKTSTHDGTPTSGTPTPLHAGDGQTQSLTRVSQTGDNATDFPALTDPSPVNNAGLAGQFGSACPTTTTTTSLPAPVTTTTTVPAVTDSLLSAKRITLKDNPRNAGKRSLVVVATDAAIALGAGNGSADDPTIHGGALRVRCGAGTCDQTSPLAANGWTKLGKGANKGYRYRDPGGAAGPVRLVLLKPGRGRVLKVLAKGAGLAVPLASDPQSVDVVLTTGSERYCLLFTGATRFRSGRSFTATGFAAPGACPP